MDQKTKTQLEIAYQNGLTYEKQGEFAKAAQYYKQALNLDPDDVAGIAIRLAAIGYAETPSAASKTYVATLFDQCAEVFDLILVDSLGYDVPNLLYEMIEAAYPETKFNNLLDLGCGTGLVGEAFYEIANKQTGVDLSEKMIEMAAERDVYQHLYTGDIVNFLKQKGKLGEWDLIIAADVLPYMGDLNDFFSLVSHKLANNGAFAFSSEDLNKIEVHTRPEFADKNQENLKKFMVGTHQRFAHATSYISHILQNYNMKLLMQHPITVRSEQGKPVPGQIYLATHS